MAVPNEHKNWLIMGAGRLFQDRLATELKTLSETRGISVVVASLPEERLLVEELGFQFAELPEEEEEPSYPCNSLDLLKGIDLSLIGVPWDLIFIGTLPQCHAASLIRCVALALAARHHVLVIVDKPFEVSERKAKAALEYCLRHAGSLMEVRAFDHYELKLCTVELRKMARAGQLGELISAQFVSVEEKEIRSKEDQSTKVFKFGFLLEHLPHQFPFWHAVQPLDRAEFFLLPDWQSYQAAGFPELRDKAGHGTTVAVFRETGAASICEAIAAKHAADTAKWVKLRTTHGLFGINHKSNRIFQMVDGAWKLIWEPSEGALSDEYAILLRTLAGLETGRPSDMPVTLDPQLAIKFVAVLEHCSLLANQEGRKGGEVHGTPLQVKSIISHQPVP